MTNSNKLGRIVVFIDADFRGGSENSYTPRVRSAYVSLGGFTFGRDVTTFCDLLAAPQTIDFQGPNAYNFNFATMIRYQFSVWKDVFQMGMAAELPNVSGTYGPNFAPIPQRVPDFPVYLQLSWGRNRSSHIRASAVFRDIYMHNTRHGQQHLLPSLGAFRAAVTSASGKPSTSSSTAFTDRASRLTFRI